eukprot:1052268-Karenia_brevis.AAC.1
MRWLKDNSGRFREQLRTATADRRKISERLLAGAVLRQIPRLQPLVAKMPEADWCKKIASCTHGFYLVRGRGERVEMYACYLKGAVWAMLLQPDPDSDMLA